MTILKDLNIPHMGSVENAKMMEWHVAEGAAFKEGDILYEIETDKAANEVEATEAGILVKQLAQTGDEFKVGDRVGLWAVPGTAAQDVQAALASRADAPEHVVTAAFAPSPSFDAEEQGGARLSPLVRRLAAEHGVDLTTLVGSGPSGRITGEDVLAATGKTSSTDQPESVPHSLRRKTIAKRMTEASAVPTLTADMEIDLTALMARRAAAKASGVAPSILALIAHAAVAVLKDHLALNAHWQDDAILRWPNIHLGMAVSTDEGLIVPVIRNADTLDALELTAAIAILAERARKGDLKPADLEGGTFTISNPGAVGPTVRAEALLNIPQVALLGLPGIVREPRAIADGDDWRVEVRTVIRPSLSFDHRALDGSPVIEYLSALKARIEAS